MRRHLLVIFLLALACQMTAKPSDAEYSRRMKTFLELYNKGPEEQFYEYSKDYLRFLKENQDQGAYCKILCNVGFFDLNHHHIYKAIQTARKLDEAVKEEGGKDYLYLSTGLMAHISMESHNITRAERYFFRAMEEAGEDDPKFNMVAYMSLAKMTVVRDVEKSLGYAQQAVDMARRHNKIDLLVQTLGVRAYVQLMKGDLKALVHTCDEYDVLRKNMDQQVGGTYDKFMQVARSVSSSDYSSAISLAKTSHLNLDHSLILIRIYAMMNDVQNGFEMMKLRYMEMDSVFSASQEANLAEMEVEMDLAKARQKISDDEKYLHRITWGAAVLIGFLIFSYLMGRKRLMEKIWRGNAELRVARDRAEESDRMKSAFIKSMSHEIRTPLNAVAGFSQLLSDPQYDFTFDERQSIKQKITNNVDAVTRIVNELLELAEGESVNSSLQKEKVSCNGLCRSILKDIEMTRQTFDVLISYETNLPDDMTVETNESIARRIIEHLLDNAQKFTKAGTIILGAAADEERHMLLISVSDTGIGIPEADRERIFENFIKLNDYVGGVGLGLPVCRHLARRLGGDVVIDPTYEKGSRFVLQLPL